MMEQTRFFVFLLITAGACQTKSGEQPNISAASPATHSADASVEGTAPLSPAAFNSGDAAINGSNDTLHVGANTVLRLTRGTINDLIGLPVLTTDTSEAYHLQQPGGSRVRRQKNSLLLTLDNGKTLRLTNDTYRMRGDNDEAADTYYEYGGTLPNLPYWIVTEQHWEDYYTWLIHQKTGQKTNIWTRPLLSPDSNQFITYIPGLESETGVNGIQVFAISQQKTALQWQRIFKYWEPLRVGWLNGHTLSIEQRRYGITGEEQLNYVRLFMTER